MWVARTGVDVNRVAKALTLARDEGCRHLAEIAQVEADSMQLPLELVRDYFCRNLHFQLGLSERNGLEYFFKQVTRLESAKALQPTTSATGSTPCSEHK
jgi:predicted solute-binding protein